MLSSKQVDVLNAALSALSFVKNPSETAICTNFATSMLDAMVNEDLRREIDRAELRARERSHFIGMSFKERKVINGYGNVKDDELHLTPINDGLGTQAEYDDAIANNRPVTIDHARKFDPKYGNAKKYAGSAYDRLCDSIANDGLERPIDVKEKRHSAK